MANALRIIRDPGAASAVLSPMRMQVLHALREPGSATTVAAQLGLPRQKVNYHVRALEDLGLVEHVEDRRRGNFTERVVRTTASHYLIDPTVLEGPDADPRVTADRFSGAHLAAVSARTVSELAELRERAEGAGKRLPTLSLETAVRFDSPKSQAAFMEELSNAVVDLLERYHDDRARDGRWFRLVVGAHPALLPGRAAKSNDDGNTEDNNEESE